MPRIRKRTASNNDPWRIRSQTLIALDDQGYPVVIRPSVFGFEGRDQTWNTHAENFLSVNRQQFQLIDVTPDLSASSSEIQLRLKAGGRIGAVPLRAADTQKVIGGLIVRPRFGWSDIGSILNRVGWAVSPVIHNLPLVPGSAREIPSWVLAAPILYRLRKLLGELKRGFHDREEVREIPRGTILWREYIAQHMVRGAWHHFPCRFPELGYDPLLRAYIRWGLEAVNQSLIPFIASDAIAHNLAEQTQQLLLELTDVHSRFPDKRAFAQILNGIGIPSQALTQGLEALAWIVDERGLAGVAQLDGLAWTMSMPELFEKWVCHLVDSWAKHIGGEISLGYRNQTVVPILWEKRTFDSLDSLVPDVVVQAGQHTFVFDAKYKSHLEEMDEQRWLEIGEGLRDEHRADVHQVLAYASLFGTERVTAVLVYPMQLSSWQRLMQAERIIMRSSLYHHERHLQLVLTGVPLGLLHSAHYENLIHTWIAHL